MSNLKPCPFCGDNAELRGGKGVASWIICNNTKCRATQGLELTGENAVKMWNTRPAEDDLKAEVERLKEVLVEIAATLATGAEISEDDIFMMCKDAIGEKAVLDRYNEKLRKRKCNE